MRTAPATPFPAAIASPLLEALMNAFVPDQAALAAPHRTAPADPSVDAALERAIAHKFGGSSVADASRYRHVAALLRARPETHQVTVVSAMQGVTDALIALTDATVAGAAWRPQWETLRERHLQAVQDLGGFDTGQTHAWLVAQFDELAALLGAIALLGASGAGAAARVHGLGEVWSARLLGAALAAQGASAAVLDARDVLVVGRNELGVAVDWEQSAVRLGA